MVGAGCARDAIVAMGSHPADALLSGAALRLLASLAFGEIPSEPLLPLVLHRQCTGASQTGAVLAAGAIHAALQAMKAHPHNADIALHGACVLDIAMQWEECRLLPAIVHAGAVDALSGALFFCARANNEPAATVAINALHAIAHSDGRPFTLAIVGAQGLIALSTALNTLGATSERIAFAACAILRLMLDWEAGTLGIPILDQGGLAAVVASLKAWGASASMRHAHAAFGVLATVAGGKQRGFMLRPLVEMGAPAAILPPLEAAGLSDARAATSGCAALSAMLRDQHWGARVAQAVVNARGVPIVAALLRAHPKSADAVVNGCRVLTEVAATSSAGALALVSQGGVSPLVSALRDAPSRTAAEWAARDWRRCWSGGRRWRCARWRRRVARRRRRPPWRATRQPPRRWCGWGSPCWRSSPRAGRTAWPRWPPCKAPASRPRRWVRNPTATAQRPTGTSRRRAPWRLAWRPP